MNPLLLKICRRHRMGYGLALFIFIVLMNIGAYVSFAVLLHVYNGIDWPSYLIGPIAFGSVLLAQKCSEEFDWETRARLEHYEYEL